MIMLCSGQDLLVETLFCSALVPFFFSLRFLFPYPLEFSLITRFRRSKATLFLMAIS